MKNMKEIHKYITYGYLWMIKLRETFVFFMSVHTIKTFFREHTLSVDLQLENRIMRAIK